MARQVSLREFQQTLVRRLNDARQTPAVAARLGVQVGDELWLVRLDEAGEVIPVPEIAPVPLAQPWFLGLANIRGNLYTVVDLAVFHGGAPTPQGSEARLLLVNERYGMNTALLVQRMMGLRHVQQLQVEETGGERPWEAVRYTDQESRSWRELEMGSLVYHNDFLQSAA